MGAPELTLERRRIAPPVVEGVPDECGHDPCQEPESAPRKMTETAKADRLDRQRRSDDVAAADIVCGQRCEGVAGRPQLVVQLTERGVEILVLRGSRLPNCRAAPSPT